MTTQSNVLRNCFFLCACVCVSVIVPTCYCLHSNPIITTRVFNVAGPHSETGSACYYSLPGINRPLPVDFFRILRISYLKPVGDLLVELPVIHPVNYETFTPALVKSKEIGASQKERIERMKETFTKVTAFLQTLGKSITK